MRHASNSGSATGDQTRLTDLEFGSLLGEGAFARVFRAQDRRNGREYAVKTLEKRLVQAHARKDSVLAEKAMLSSLDHPGVVRLHFAFQDDWSLYFVLELVQGGELATQIARMGTCSLDFAKYYTAEIVAILTYLRARRVAHRDLKPENLLLTTEGHLKLVDFDAAVFVLEEGEGDAAAGCSQGQPSFVGTALYLPPEVLLGTARSQEAFALDLWALGCVLFLMLVGETPFQAATEYLTFQRILHNECTIPTDFHPAARALVTALLTPQPMARLGIGPEGLAEVEQHALFGGSRAAFAELRRGAPPRRVERSTVGAGAGPPSPTDSLHSFDFASSAECTPEVGQRFLARISAALPLGRSLSDKDVGNGVDSLSLASHASLARSPSVDGPPTPAQASAPPAAPCVQSDGCCGVGLAPGRQGWGRRESPASSSSQPVSSGASAMLLPPEPQWRALMSTPGPSWRQWLCDLAERRTLVGGEGVALCGCVVRRRLPCLRPRVLVLTDLPRLLVLDASGRGLLHDICLRSPAQQHSAEAEEEPSIAVCSRVDFVLNAAGRRFRCCDVHLGAEVWASELKRARAVLSHHLPRS